MFARASTGSMSDGFRGSRVWPRRVAVLSCAVATSLVVSMLQGLPALAAPHHNGASKPSTSSVPVGKAKAKSPVRSQTDVGSATLSRRALPRAASADVTASGAAVNVGGLPVTATALPGAGRDDLVVGHRLAAGVAGVSSVRVRVVDPAVAQAAGVHGAVLAVNRSDKSPASGAVRLRLDYTGFAEAYGADYGNRLQLVQLPACVLSSPSQPVCQQRTPLGSVNAGGAVSATVVAAADPTAAGAQPAGGQSMVVALDATASSQGGTFTATSLKPSYSWSAGTPSGEFSWTYPMKAPASLGGPAPDVSLGYSSGSVDAQTLASNGQTSWVGEGWDLQTGYIERSYRTCSLDGGSTGDLCWFSTYNATMVFKGQSVRLVRDNTSGVWHASSDSALKIEDLTGTAGTVGDNGSKNLEYWRVTTQDGAQYYFGANKRYPGDTATTSSTLTEPVFGNNPGEPCYNSNFANAACWQAYRWNLDYVVDPRGNSMTYFYTRWGGAYGAQNGKVAVLYDMSATLDHIDYGTRAGSEAAGAAPMQVWFTKSNRCTGSCGQNTADYPDTPWDLYCKSGSSSCPSLTSMVYWSPYKLSTVYTQIWDAGLNGYRKVDQWDLGYTYPPTGDNISPAGNDTSPNLWLNTLTHTGYATDGVTSLAEPTITFGGTGMFNRVNWGNSIGVAPYTHYRLTSISNGTGGQSLVSYSATSCPTFPAAPVPDSNPYPCFPEFFKPQQAQPGWDWFNKFLVTGVTQHDLVGGSPDEVYSYAYSSAGSSDTALWHHDYSETATLTYRSWDLWQGYPSVTVTHGASGGPQTVTTSTYYRGMNGDGKNSTDSQSVVWNSRQAGVTGTLGAVPGAVGALAGAARCVWTSPVGVPPTARTLSCSSAWPGRPTRCGRRCRTTRGRSA